MKRRRPNDILHWALLPIMLLFSLPAFSQDTIYLRGDTIRVGELEWDMEKDWRSRGDLISDNKALYGEHVRILLKYHRNKMVEQMVFGYIAEDSGFIAHGPARYYYPSGQLLGKRYHTLGILEGPALDYYKSGSTKVRTHYQQDRLHGSYETFFEDGRQELQAQYDHGLPIGLHQAWYSNGQRKWVEQYEGGLRAGPDTTFYETGTIEAIAKYAEGKPDGTWLFFHRNGAPWSERVYLQGKLENVGFLKNREGRPLEIGSFHNGNGWLYIYNDDGLPQERELYKHGLLKKIKPVKP